MRRLKGYRLYLLAVVVVYFDMLLLTTTLTTAPRPAITIYDLV